MINDDTPITRWLHEHSFETIFCILAVCVVGFLGLLIHDYIEREDRCLAAHGVYLGRENKCVTGITEIRP